MLTMPKRILEKTKQRAVRPVLDRLHEYPNLTVACETVSQRLGYGSPSRCAGGCGKRRSTLVSGRV
jgi:hypothetical protein